MKKNKKNTISLVISFILLVSFLIIIFSKSNMFNKLFGNISNVINSSDVSIKFKTVNNNIIIESDLSNLKYQIIESDFDTVNQVRLAIKERDNFIKGYDKYIDQYDDSDLINRFKNGKDKIVTSTNEKINKILGDLSLNNNWINLENNIISLNDDNKDRLIFVSENGKNYIYYSIKSKELLNFEDCPISEAYLKYTILTDEERKERGYIPPYCEVNEEIEEKIVDDGIIDGSIESDIASSKYPSNFGTNEYFNTTLRKIKNQGQTPNCVMYGTTASLEDYLLKKYNQPYYFSERYAAYKMSRPFKDGVNQIGARTDLVDGGFRTWTAARFLGYYGPVYEDEMPFIDSTDSIYLSEITDKIPKVDVNKVLLSYTLSLDKLKEYIVKYGGVAATICWSSTYIKNGNYFYSGCPIADSTHKITIIGWDDNYPASNFNNASGVPSGNGAYIVKNSFGTRPDHLNGYFYMSYDQAITDFISVQDADFSFSDNKYLYDYGGYEKSPSTTIVYDAIKFEKKNSKEKLTKIRFSSDGSNNVEIYLINDGSKSLKISNATLIGQMEATKGINTYELDTPIELNYSSSYIIIKSGKIIQLSSPSYSSIPSGKMFYSTDGNTFVDSKDDGSTLLIAAYTDDINTSDTTKPVAVIAGGESPKENSQTLLLQCRDKEGVTGYYYGTTRPSLSNMTNTTNLDKINNEGITTTINNTGTYYLGCRDAAGNYEVTSAVIKNLTMTTMTQKFSGNKTPYNTDNYDEYVTKSYLVRKGVNIRIVTNYTKPDNINYSYVGYATELSGTPNTDPTDIVISDDIHIYSWFNIEDLNIMISSGPNGSLKVETIMQQNNSVTVNANSRGNISVKPGDTLKITAIPNSGYKLDSWSLSGISGSSSPSYIHNNTSHGLLSASFSNSITTYDVTYKNGNETYGEVQSVKKGTVASKPIDPTNGNKKFLYWSTTDGGTEYNFSNAVNSNLTLYAVYEEPIVNYTVTFNSKGGSSVASQTIQSGGKATKPSNPTKTGYTFKHWSTTDGGTAYDFNTAITGNLTLYAVWDIKQYTVTFDSTGGSSVASQTVNYNEKATKPSNPTKTEYTFKHWSTSENGTAYDFNTIVTGDMTLYTVWTQNSIQIKDETNMYIRDGKFYVRPTELLYIDKNTIFTNLVSTSGVNIYDKDNNVVSDGTASIATGYKISSGEKNYTIVIYGDIDLDGTVTSNDLRLEYNHITAGLNLGELSLSAADFDGDGIVGVNDLRNIYMLITH